MSGDIDHLPWPLIKAGYDEVREVRRRGFRILSPEEVEALPDETKDILGIPRQAPDKE